MATGVTTKPRVLFLDPTYAGPLADNSWAYQCLLMFALRLGCHCEKLVVSGQTPALADSSKYSEDWDFIIVPWVSSAAVYYTALTNALALFTDTTIPVYCRPLMTTVTGSTVTGVTSITAGAADHVCSAGLTNWESRRAGRITFYGRAVTAFSGSDHTVHAVNASGQATLWSRDVQSHPTLFVAPHTTGNNSTYTADKPWLAFQWMVDQQSTEAKKAALRRKIHKAQMTQRWDVGNIVETVTAFNAGDLDIVYDSLTNFGVKSVQVAWTSLSAADDGNLPLLQWFLDRRLSTGHGILEFHEHNIDVVDGVGEACSSDGRLFDQFEQADTAYRAKCDVLTGLGFQLGSDGYGRGMPVTQDSNLMNNPSAKFFGDTAYGGFGGIGADIWLLYSASVGNYPSNEETPATKMAHSRNWNGARTLISFNHDALDASTSLEISLTFNGNINKCFIYGGGFYLHGDGLQNFADFVDEYGQIFTSAPDVVGSGPYSELRKQLLRGLPHYYVLA